MRSDRIVAIVTKRHGCGARVVAIGGTMTRALPPPRDPQSSITRALCRLEARFGPDAVRRLRDAPTRLPGEVALPSGMVGLDVATGLDGLPRGHLTEIFGPESAGKTTLLYAALA